MEYCSPLWAGAPASHLSRLHAVETKAFWIIGISRDEAESLGLSLSHRRLVGGLSVFYRLLSSLATPPPCSLCNLSPPHFRRALKVRQQPPSVKTTKITNHCSPSLFHFSFFAHLWNKLPHSIHSHSSLQAFKTAGHHHLLSFPIQNLDLFLPPLIHSNSPPSNSLLSFLKVPVV